MKKNIYFALILILIAVYIVIRKLGFLPGFHIPVFTILFTLIFAYGAISGFMHLNFMQGFLSLGIVGCLNDKLLHIERLTPFTLMIAACLLGMAFDLLFKNHKHNHTFCYNNNLNYSQDVVDMDESQNQADTQSQTSYGNGQFVDYGPNVNISNTFGSISKYVNSRFLSTAHLENAFGTATVYFNNVTLAPGANCHVENSFGTTNLYLPRTWKVIVRQDSVFGNIAYHGTPSNDVNAPTLNLKLESSFGTLKVYFE